jgi:hypothetical protein
MKQFLTANRDVLLVELSDGTGVLLHLGTKFYFTLNATGLVVWKTLGEPSGGVTPVHIAEALSRHFRVDAEQAKRDLDPLLAEMRSEGLVASVG